MGGNTLLRDKPSGVVLSSTNLSVMRDGFQLVRWTVPWSHPLKTIHGTPRLFTITYNIRCATYIQTGNMTGLFIRTLHPSFLSPLGPLIDSRIYYVQCKYNCTEFPMVA